MNDDRKERLGGNVCDKGGCNAMGAEEANSAKAQSDGVHSEFYKLEIFQIHLKLWEEW